MTDDFFDVNSGPRGRRKTCFAARVFSCYFVIVVYCTNMKV
jgi:hypothetical protein